MRTEQRVSRLGLLSHLAIPFDLNGQKVTVNTSPGGVKVSLKLSELGKYIARYYLSKIGVAAALVEALFDIKFGMSSTLNYNYEKFKTSGLSGLVQGTLCAMACVQLDGVTWKPTGMLTAFSKGKGEKSRPLRSLVLAVKAALNVTPKSKYVPLGGQLVIKYCCQYEEFEDRIDIMFMDVNIKGGLKYTANVDVSLSASLPFCAAWGVRWPDPAREPSPARQIYNKRFVRQGQYRHIRLLLRSPSGAGRVPEQSQPGIPPAAGHPLLHEDGGNPGPDVVLG